MAAVVDLAGVSIVRNGSTLISDIAWEVDESDRWVVIGPNGAGKTTLLQVISAQIHPSSGVAGLLVRCSALSTFSSCAPDRADVCCVGRAHPAGSGSMTSSSPPRTRYSVAGRSSTTIWITNEPMSYSLSCA